MNILIFGKENDLMNSFIHKAQKEKNRIFLFTDTTSHLEKPQGVFELYVFDYNSTSIKSVLESVRPDRVMFFGAFDSDFSTDDPRFERKSLDFISGLMNILMACNVAGVKEFVHISSGAVYEQEYTAAITEETPLTPSSFKSLVMAQAEDMVRRYGETTSMNVTVIRLDNLYCIPKNRAAATDFCSKMCLSLLINNHIVYNENHRFSGLYISDAIEGIFKIVIAEKRNHVTYNLSNDKLTNEKEIADFLLDYKKSDTKFINRTIGKKYRVLDSTRAREEFGITTICDYEKSVRKVFTFLSRHLSRYLTPEEKEKRSILDRFSDKTKRLIRLLWGIIENLLFFILVFVADFYTQNSAYFDRLDFYLLYVLGFAIVYGRQQAIFSACLSILGFAFTQSIARESTFQVLIDYNTYVWIAQLFIVGMTVGHLKERIKIITDYKDEEIDYLSVQLDEIEEIDDSNNRIKHVYENRLINYNKSFGMLYDIISKIDAMEPGAVLYQTATAVSEIMDSEDVAVYRANNEYARLVAATSQKARSYGKSIKYLNYGLMTKAFEDRRVFINKVLDRNLPSMAIALYANDKIDVIIMIWGINIDNLTLYNSDLLTVLGRIIAEAAYKAGVYLDALADKRYVGATNILDKDAFSKILKVQTDAALSGLTECVLLTFDLQGMTIEEFDVQLNHAVRPTDYFGITGDGDVSLLLINTNISEAQLVETRLAAYDIKVERKIDITEGAEK